MTSRVIAYVRVSGIHPSTISTIAQKELIHAHAEKYKLKIDATVYEVASSNRIIPPKLQTLVRDFKKGDTLLVAMVDRLSKNIGNGNYILESASTNFANITEVVRSQTTDNYAGWNHFQEQFKVAQEEVENDFFRKEIEKRFGPKAN